MTHANPSEPNGTPARKRLSYAASAPAAVGMLLAMSRHLAEHASIEESLLGLVQLRASQVNGCAFCTVLHVNDARDAGETDERLHALVVWRDTPYFTERERIALDWAETLTDLAHNHVDDARYERAVAEFGERGLTELTLAIGAINAWNRLGVAFAAPPDQSYRTRRAKTAAPATT